MRGNWVLKSSRLPFAMEAARERQLTEVESVEAIFAEEFSPLGGWREDPGAKEEVAFTIDLSPELSLCFRLPEDYPEAARPTVELRWSGSADVSRLRQELVEHVEAQALDEEMVFNIISWCQERLAEGIDAGEVPETPEASNPAAAALVAAAEVPAAAEGGLPLASYFRAEALGEGACGAVMHVYDEEGLEWAAKQFERAEDGGVDTTTMREIAFLRSLRAADLLHPNVVALHDMAPINGELCMIMASYKCSLRDALKGGAVKGAQLRVAHGLLSAVAFMHSLKAMHRDIKPGNVMLTDELDPVLIDFSLAKVDLGESQQVVERVARTAKERRRKARGKKAKAAEGEQQARHSQGVGTPLYMAPEVIESEAYGNSADIWSLGVVLLEVFDPEFCVKFDECEKEKAAHALIASTVGRLGSKPVPALLRGLLEVEPGRRLGAQEALERLQAAAPQPGSATAAVQARAASTQLASSLPGQLPQELVAEVKRWVSFFRCSARVQFYALVYAARARCEPLLAVVLAGRLHEADPEAAPLWDIEELEEWVMDEAEDEECMEGLSELENFIEKEQQLLRELDYVLY